MIFVFSVIILVILYIKIGNPIIKRYSLIRKLRRVSNANGIKLTVLRSPILSLFKLSSKTELSVETENKVFLIRLISSQGQKRVLHFASSAYLVSFSRIWYTFAGRSRYKPVLLMTDHVNKNIKVRILPEHKRCKVPVGKECIDVLLFTPAPMLLTCVAAGKTSVENVNAGDTLHGAMIFAGASFASYLDREGYKEKDKEFS